MKKLRSIKFQIDNKHNRLGFFVCCLMLCVSLFLTACSKDGTSDHDAISGESTVSNTTQKQGWVYVPEVITVGDEHADYERMQPVGDTFCYVSLGGEAEDSVRSICRYSLTDRELTTVSIDWPEGGNNWDIGYRFFTQDQGLYMTANVYPADYSSMKRFCAGLIRKETACFLKILQSRPGEMSLFAG